MKKISAMQEAAADGEPDLWQEVTLFEQCSGQAQRYTSIGMFNLIRFAVIEEDFDKALDALNQNVLPILEDVENCLGRELLIARDNVTRMMNILARGPEDIEQKKKFFLNTVQGAVEAFWFDYTKGATKAPGRVGQKQWKRRTENVQQKMRRKSRLEGIK